MLASFDYRLSKEEYGRGLQAISLSLSSQDRWRSARCLALFAIIGIAIATAAIFHPGSTEGTLLAILLIWLPYGYMQVRFLRHWRELAYDSAIASRSVTLSDEGLAERHDRGKSEWPWEGVRRLHELQDIIVVEVANWHAITLPHRLWAGADERSKFLDQLRERAPDLLPELTASKYNIATPAGLLMFVGSIAAAFDVFILANVLVPLTGFDPCSCALRRSPSFHLFVAAMLVLSIGTMILTMAGLHRLMRKRPRLASGVALGAIGLLCGVILIGALQHHR